MTILEFVEKYNALTSETLKNGLIETHIRRKYCPVLEKRTILQMMLDSAVMTSETGIQYIDMMTSRINYTVAMIVLYTDLTVDADKDNNGRTYESYDALVKSGLVAKFCEAIGIDEVKEFSDVNSMLIANFEKSKGSLEAFCANALKKFVQTIGDAVDLAGNPDTLNELVRVLNQVNKS